MLLASFIIAVTVSFRYIFHIFIGNSIAIILLPIMGISFLSSIFLAVKASGEIQREHSKGTYLVKIVFILALVGICFATVTLFSGPYI